MKLNENIYLGLPQRITEIFSEIDSDICMELLHADEKYAELFNKSDELQKMHPFIMAVLEGSGEVTLTAEEHDALIEYLGVKIEMDDIERQHIYFHGHKDNFAYLKKIGVI